MKRRRAKRWIECLNCNDTDRPRSLRGLVPAGAWPRQAMDRRGNSSKQSDRAEVRVPHMWDYRSGDTKREVYRRPSTSNSVEAASTSTARLSALRLLQRSSRQLANAVQQRSAMKKTIRFAPPNITIFVSDASGGIVPDFVDGKLVLSTDTMVSVGCLPDVDGETTITLGSSAEVEPIQELVFDGLLETPTGKLVVSTVEDDEVVGTDVPSPETRVRIWTNRLSFPDEIVIGWGD